MGGGSVERRRVSPGSVYGSHRVVSASLDLAHASAAAGRYAEGVAAMPYMRTGLNPYDYRRPTPYDESGVVAFYNNASVQTRLGVVTPVLWEAHSVQLFYAFVYSGDWESQTDYLFERLLRSGVSVLKYQGMVDCKSAVDEADHRDMQLHRRSEDHVEPAGFCASVRVQQPHDETVAIGGLIQMSAGGRDLVLHRD